VGVRGGVMQDDPPVIAEHPYSKETEHCITGKNILSGWEWQVFVESGLR
jgi:hypothetical protein